MFESDSQSPPAVSRQDHLLVRVWSILAHPARTWDAIAAETFRPDIVYGRYVLLLAAFPPLCWLIGDMVFGHAVPGFSPHHFPVLAAITGAATWYVIGFIGVYIAALLVDLAVPLCGGHRDFANAFLLAAYGLMPAWLGGVFGLFPPVSLLAVVGAPYSVFLIGLGLPRLLAVPRGRRIACAMVCGVIILSIPVLAAVTGNGVAQALNGVTGRAAVPNRTVTRASAPPSAVKSSAPAPDRAPKITPDPNVLLPLLPASFLGVPRRDETAVRAGAGDIAASTAGASYAVASGLTLRVSIMHVAGGINATAVMNVNSSSNTDVVTTVDGTMTEALSDRAHRTAIYTIKTADGVVVTAQGNADMATLKALAEAVDMQKAEVLAK